MNAETLGKHMFLRESADYMAEPALVELAWADDQIRAVWVARASDVLAFLGVA